MDMEEKLKQIQELDREAADEAISVAVLADELDIEVTDPRAGRGLLWLVATLGKPAVSEAVAGLVGGQHHYPLNVARKLGVKLAPSAGPAIRAQLLRASVRIELTRLERDRQADAAASARRVNRGAP